MPRKRRARHVLLKALFCMGRNGATVENIMDKYIRACEERTRNQQEIEGNGGASRNNENR